MRCPSPFIMHLKIEGLPDTVILMHGCALLTRVERFGTFSQPQVQKGASSYKRPAICSPFHPQ